MHIPGKKNLLDALDELLDLPAEERLARLAALSLGADERAELERCLILTNQARSFLELPPEAVLKNREIGPIDLIADTEGPGTIIDRYKLVEKIGEGGFGVVYVAEQSVPVRRQVALKIIKPGMDTRAIVGRFEAERQALAMMDHPHIAKVFDAGATAIGRPYFVMELVDGIPITQYCDDRQLTLVERLKLFAQLCHAIQHAHQKGIIHRDIKPSNILVAMHDGIPVPKVIDFGIAKATQGELTDKTVHTQLQHFIGTPAYMSPEQAASLDMDTRSDIYSLGVLLYELLTGTTPFERAELLQIGLDAMRRRIREVEPPRPSTRFGSMTREESTSAAKHRGMDSRRLVHQLRGDLDWIVMKCLEKDRGRRYDSASDVASDIQRHLNGEVIVARPPSALYRFQKLVWRNQLAFGATAAVMSVLIAGVCISTREAIRANKAGNEAIAAMNQAKAANANEAVQRYQAEANLLESLRQQGQSLVAEADALGMAGRWWESRQKMEGAFQLLLQSKLPPLSAELGLFDQYVTSPPSLITFTGHTGGVLGLAISPNGLTVLSGAGDNTLKLWEMATGRNIRTFTGHTGRIVSVAISHDGRLALSGSDDKTAKLWDISTGRVIQIFSGFAGFVRGAVFSPDDQNVLMCCSGASLKLWSVSTGREVRTLFDHDGGIHGIALSPNGQTILSWSNDPALKSWDVFTGSELHTFRGHAGWVTCGAISPDGKTALSTSWDGSIILWDMSTGSEIRIFCAHKAAVYSVAFSPDGKTAISTSFDRTLKLWDVATGSELHTFVGHNDAVTSVAFSPDGKSAISASFDSQLRWWDVRVGSDIRTFEGHRGSVNGVAFSHDGRTGLSAGDDKTVMLWDLATGHRLRTLSGHTDAVTCVAYSSDDRTAISCSADKTLILWDLATGHRIRRFVGHSSIVRHVALSPDGRTALSASDDKTMRLWDLSTGRELHVFTGHTGNVYCAVFSPDGKTAISTSQDRTLKLWDIATGRELRTFTDNTDGVLAAAFSPDGRLVLSGSNDRTVKLFDLASGRLTQTFAGHTLGVLSVAFSPDGRTAYSVGGDLTMIAWDIATGREIHSFVWPGGGHMMDISPDGRSIFSGNEDGSLNLLDFDRVGIYHDFEQKVPSAQSAISENQRDQSALETLGRWWAFRDKDDFAAEYFERARSCGAEISPLELGRCYWNLKRFADAKREFAQLITTDIDPAKRFYLELCIGAIDTSAASPPASLQTQIPPVQ